MKTKNNIIILVLFTVSFLSISPIYAQKIHLYYKLMNKDNDSLLFMDKPLSDKLIQNHFEHDYLKRINVYFKPVSLSDNLNRKFEEIDINDTTLFLRILTEGHYRLYSKCVGIQNNYLLITPTDTVELKKEDKIADSYLKEDNKYIGQLRYLANDFPEIAKTADKVKFKTSSLQKFVHNLNCQYPNEDKKLFATEPTVSYLQLGVKAFYSTNRKNYTFDLMSCHYKLELSNNLSFRYGLSANYHQQIADVPESWSITTFTIYSGWGTYTDYDSTLLQTAHRETMTRKFIEIPLVINWEFTNWFVTPYGYLGVSPSIENKIISTSDKSNDYNSGWLIRLNPIGGAGVKAKLTNNITLFTEIKLDFKIEMRYSMFGVAYLIPMKGLNPTKRY
jgi:hypothetical protein